MAPRAYCACLRGPHLGNLHMYVDWGGGGGWREWAGDRGGGREGGGVIEPPR